MNSQYITSADGIRIAYSISGSGKSVFLLHGAGQTKSNWEKLGYIKRLEKHFKVISVDLRGSGESECRTTITDFEIKRIYSDIIQIADECKVDTFTIIGYSLGGNIARYFGAWSKRTTALVLLGVPLGPAVDEEFDQYINTFTDKYKKLIDENGKQTITKGQKNGNIKGSITALIYLFQAMRQWPAIEANELRCPTLMIAGTKNTRAINWIEKNRNSLDEAKITVDIILGLNHPQEFTQIDKIYPHINSFLLKHHVHVSTE
jgi:pimeloyl-ACP methyl ester carboxylesterase